MKKSEVKEWCKENNFALIDLNHRFPDVEYVKTIAEKACYVDDILNKGRLGSASFSRYLAMNYLINFIPPGKVAKIFGKSHCMTSHAVSVLSDDLKFYKPWQREAIKYFNSKISEMEERYEKNKGLRE